MISAVVAAAALALGQQVDPHDFEVDVDIKPDVVVPATPSCVPAEGGGFLCTAQLTDTAAGKSVSGSARQVSTGKTGTFRMTIDWSLSLRAVVLVRNFAVESFRELSGGGQHTASWSIETADGTYVGDMRGTMRVSLAGPLTGRYEGQLTVNVVSGPGGVVGSGTFSHSQDFPLPTAARLLSLVAATPSTLDLTLSPGKPRARIASPGSGLKRATDGGLRVVTVPGSTCKATARKGTRTVTLGSARDGDRDGTVVVVRKLRPRLTPGRWTIVATCTRATARAVVAVS